MSSSLALAISTFAQIGEGARAAPERGVTAEQALLWIGLLLACLVVAGGAIHLLRRYLKQPARGESRPAWTMMQLREMLDDGKITPKEYETLKRTLRTPADD